VPIRNRPTVKWHARFEAQYVASAATYTEHRGDSTTQHNGKDQEGCDRGAGSSSIGGAARCFLSSLCNLRRLLFGLIHALLCLLRADVVLGGHQLVQALAGLSRPRVHRDADLFLFEIKLLNEGRQCLAVEFIAALDELGPGCG
jgi:hypothetical protein